MCVCVECVDVEEGSLIFLMPFFALFPHDISMGGKTSFISTLCIKAKKNM